MSTSIYIETRHETPNPSFHILVSEPMSQWKLGARERWHSPGIPGLPLEDEGNIRTVHLMSKPAGGESRGYWLVNDRLWLRSPSYTGVWEEIDDLVSEVLGVPVAPYQLVGSRVQWDTPAS